MIATVERRRQGPTLLTGIGNARPAGEGPSRQGEMARFTGAAHGAVFEDDIMLPEQFFARLCHRSDYPGEQRLMLAVLEDAVHCFQTNVVARTTRRQRLFDEAEEWLFEEGTDASVSFRYICELFGLDIDYLRSGLRQWRDRKRAAAKRQTVVPIVSGVVRETVAELEKVAG